MQVGDKIYIAGEIDGEFCKRSMRVIKITGDDIKVKMKDGTILHLDKSDFEEEEANA